jgi:microtubule-associated protein-like 6
MQAAAAQDEFGFDVEEAGAGDERLAVQPWKGQIKAPADYKRAPKGANLAPNIELQLDWVHGYKGDNAKNNLQYMADQTLAYYIAGVGVVYNPATHTQKFFTEHTDDVTCMDFHPGGKLCLTGENGRRPRAYIWDSSTCQKVHCLFGNNIEKTVIACAFSKSGNKCVVIAGDDEHHMAVYDTESGGCIAKGKGVRKNVIDVKWKDDNTFALVGSKLYCEVTVTNGSFKKVNGKFGNNDQRHGSLVFNGTTGLSGAITGQLYQWNGASIIGQPKKLHERIIDAICVSGNHVLTGGRDGKINVLNQSYTPVFSIDIN